MSELLATIALALGSFVGFFVVIYLAIEAFVGMWEDR